MLAVDCSTLHRSSAAFAAKPTFPTTLVASFALACFPASGLRDAAFVAAGAALGCLTAALAGSFWLFRPKVLRANALTAKRGLLLPLVHVDWTGLLVSEVAVETGFESLHRLLDESDRSLRAELNPELLLVRLEIPLALFRSALSLVLKNLSLSNIDDAFDCFPMLPLDGAVVVVPAPARRVT